ncbi:hypothetical protein [Roseateles sp.]|uniref:hypothetical protein n=1 Tax=Roseateles sp. TaxID=1971397 RepID=UPI003D112380
MKIKRFAAAVVLLAVALTVASAAGRPWYVVQSASSNVALMLVDADGTQNNGGDITTLAFVMLKGMTEQEPRWDTQKAYVQFNCHAKTARMIVAQSLLRGQEVASNVTVLLPLENFAPGSPVAPLVPFACPPDGDLKTVARPTFKVDSLPTTDEARRDVFSKFNRWRRQNGLSTDD